MPKIKVKGQTVQTGERPQTNGQTYTHTHGHYQTYYLPCYVVDKEYFTQPFLDQPGLADCPLNFLPPFVSTNSKY